MDVEQIDKYLKDGSIIRNSIDVNKIYEFGITMSKSFHSGNKLIIMGNGGSAADAQHLAAEFVGRFEKERSPLPALALHSNTSSITAIGNDYGFDHIYSRQITAFAKNGDFVLGLSTSGDSLNVIKALEVSNEIGCVNHGITGISGGKMLEVLGEDHIIKIESNRTSFIQECTIAIIHILSKIVEDLM
jgi:D-sedoheptulose 7-phosphate isomerase